MSTPTPALLDDTDSAIHYTPADAWEASYVCDECRQANNASGIADSAYNRTWTTALANAPTSNITIQFRGTTATAYFIVFTRVADVTNINLAPENIATISFYLNGTLLNSSSSSFDHHFPLSFTNWWYPESDLFPQEDFLPDMSLLDEPGLGVGMHTLTAVYQLNSTSPSERPQVYIAFDRLEYMPIPTDAPGSSSNVPPTTDMPSPSAIPDTATPGPSLSPNESADTLTTSTVLGLSIGLPLLATIIIAAALLAFYRRRRRRHRAESTLRESGQNYRKSSAVSRDAAGGGGGDGNSELGGEDGHNLIVLEPFRYDLSNNDSDSNGDRALKSVPSQPSGDLQMVGTSHTGVRIKRAAGLHHAEGDGEGDLGIQHCPGGSGEGGDGQQQVSPTHSNRRRVPEKVRQRHLLVHGVPVQEAAETEVEDNVGGTGAARSSGTVQPPPGQANGDPDYEVGTRPPSYTSDAGYER